MELQPLFLVILHQFFCKIPSRAVFWNIGKKITSYKKMVFTFAFLYVMMYVVGDGISHDYP